MPVSIGFILAAILLPTVGFAIWMAGHFLRARRAEISAILARGLPAQALVVRSRRGRVDYRFEVSGWDRPIRGHGRVAGGKAPAQGEHVAIRYLPGHPHVNAMEADVRAQARAGAKVPDVES